jgi:phosphoribosylanthranilate isomerase
MLVKICGTTSIHDALLTQDAGADYLGVIFHAPSPRNVDLATAIAIRDAVNIPVVAITVNFSLEQLLELNRELAPAVLQLHGDEPPQIIEALAEQDLHVWAAVGGDEARERANILLQAGVEAVLVDSRAKTQTGDTIYGGTGKRSDWDLARELREAGARVILSGGLSPDNVAQAIATVGPWLVDTVSGVESKPGVKDENKLRQFIRKAKTSS